MKQYGIGIIGCGGISAMHVAALREIPRARLVAGAEAVEDRRRKFAEANGVPCVSDYHELLRLPGVDVVCVCTPSGLHMEPALAAARAGKHIICEKPVEVTLERIDAILRETAARGVRLCAIFPMRFDPAAALIKHAVDQGRFGRLTLGDCYNKWWRSEQYFETAKWRGTWKLDGGGACMNQGIHAIDMIQWFMGPVESVSAQTDRLVHPAIETEDTAAAVLRYRNGAVGVIQCATSVFPGADRRIEVLGDKGMAVLEGESLAKWQFAEERPDDAELRRRYSPQGVAQRNANDPLAFNHARHREQIAEFLDALDAGREPRVGGPEGRKAVEIILAIYESARTGRTVRLPLGSAAS
jgi:predicted dehydrogenase